MPKTNQHKARYYRQMCQDGYGSPERLAGPSAATFFRHRLPIGRKRDGRHGSRFYSGHRCFGGSGGLCSWHVGFCRRCRPPRWAEVAFAEAGKVVEIRVTRTMLPVALQQDVLQTLCSFFHALRAIRGDNVRHQEHQ